MPTTLTKGMANKRKAAPKKPVKRKPTSKKTPTKRKFVSGDQNAPGIWSGDSSNFSSGDIYGNAPAPNALDLLYAYEDIVYSCVKYISDQVGKHADDVKLCVATSANDPKARSFALCRRCRVP